MQTYVIFLISQNIDIIYFICIIAGLLYQNAQRFDTMVNKVC